MTNDGKKNLTVLCGIGVAFVAVGTFGLKWQLGCVVTGLVILKVVRICVDTNR